MGSATEAPAWSPKEQAAMEDIVSRWEAEQSGWDSNHQDGRLNEPGLWHQLPEVDSKDVALLLGVFEEHLGIEADVSMIREGGYDSMEGAAEHILLQLRAKQEDQPPVEDAS